MIVFRERPVSNGYDHEEFLSVTEVMSEEEPIDVWLFLEWGVMLKFIADGLTSLISI